jgi:hypothetical protein
VRARPSVTSAAPYLLAAALAVAGATVAAPRAGAESRVFEGRWNWEHPNELRLAEDEVFPHTPYGRGWQARSWYWMGRFDNGYLVVMNPFQWRYGALGAWGMYLIVRDPHGGVFTWDGKIGDPEVAPRGMRVVSDGARFESRTGAHRWIVEVPGFSCDFTFTNVLPAWKPGNGMARFDHDFYLAYRLPAPWADLAGTMTVDGLTVDAAGQCFYDTTEYQVPLSRTTAGSHAARVWSAPGTPREDRWFLDVLTTIPHPGFGMPDLPMLVVARGGRWVMTTKDYTFDFVETVTPDDPPYPYPVRIAVSARDPNGSLVGVFDLEPPYVTTDVFDRLPGVFRALASLFLRRPVIYRNLARFTGLLTEPDGRTTDLDLSGQAEFAISR